MCPTTGVRGSLGVAVKSTWTTNVSASQFFSIPVLKVPPERNSCSIGPRPIELVPLLGFMTKGTHSEMRRYQRISLPKGMVVAWYGGGQQQASRAKTLGMGGLFLSGSTTTDRVR